MSGMERKTSGFRTAMEQASDISSINSNEFLEPGNSHGEMHYDLYGMADSGLEHSVNKDNLYMDGIYMKSFQFSHYSKGIRTLGDIALFALCGPALHSGDTALTATKIMDVIDKIRPMLCRLSAEDGGEVIQEFVQNEFPGTEEHNMAFGAIYAATDGVAAIAMGGAVVYRLKGSRLLPVGGSKQNAECFLGHEINGDCDIIPLKGEETYVICSSVVANEFAPETIAEAVCGGSPEEAVRRIMDKGVTVCRGQNISMMVVHISSSKKKSDSVFPTKLRVPVAAVCAAAAIAASIFGISFMRNDKIVNDSGEGETLEEFNRNIEDKAAAEAALAEFDAKLLETETALKVYLEVLAECEKEGLNNGSESNKAIFLKLNDSVYMINSDLKKIQTEIESVKSHSKKGSELLVDVENLRTLVDGLDYTLTVVENASKEAVSAMAQKRQQPVIRINTGSSSYNSGRSSAQSRRGTSSGYSGGSSSGASVSVPSNGAASGISD